MESHETLWPRVADPMTDVAILDGIAFPQPRPGELWAVGAVIHDGQGRVFVQRRARDRTLFPGAWDLVGGHLESGESVLSALCREVREETGWEVRRVVADLGVVRWTGDDGRTRREADYLVEVAGDLSHPTVERGKHEDPRWIRPEDASLLLEGRHPSDTLVADIIRRAADALVRR